MSKLGKNMKLTAPTSDRDQARDVYGSILGGVRSTPHPEMDLFVFDDGFHMGVYFADGADVLTAEQQRLAAWLEFVVEDELATAERLLTAGCSRIDYVDKEHAYFAGPGGQVFRLGRAGRL
jgi:hypothetical protein